MTETRALSGWAAVAVLAFGGCTADEAIVWTPDSTGIVFAAKGTDATPERRAVTAVHHFDIRSKAMHVVVSSKDRTGTTLPAVSPDGKKVAVAQAWTWSRGQYIQVCTYRLDGTIDIGSKAFRLFNPIGILCPHWFTINPFTGPLLSAGATEENDTALAKGLFEKPYIVESKVEWSPDGRYLLAHTPMGCVRYDLEAKTFRQFAPSVTVGLHGFIGRCVLPNGKGFIAAWNGSWTKASPPSELSTLLKSLILVDWEGVSRRFSVSPEAERAVKGFAEEAQAEFEGGAPHFLDEGRWEGQVVIVPLSAGSLLIDPASRTVTYRDDPAVQRLRLWARRNRVVAVMTIGDDMTVVVAWGGRIDVRTRGAAWKTLSYGVNGRPRFFQSPNRRFVAVRFWTKKDVRRTLIVDSQGGIVGDFDVE
jgi:hypothetical protein